MRKLLIPIILLGLIFIGCSDRDSAEVIEKEESTNTTKSLKYSLQTLDGKTIKFEMDNKIVLSDELNGKIVLFNFWATWCPPCRKEIPAFVELQKKYKDDFIIVGVLMEKGKDKKELQEFLDEFDVNFPISISEDDNFRFAKDIANVQKLPESYLFTKEGIFVKQFIGAIDEKVLENYILESK